MKLHAQNQLYTLISFWDIKVFKASLGIPDHTHLNLHCQFITLINMKLHAQNQVYTATKINESTTNILKLLFFTINLHFVKSNQISINRKLNLPLTGSIYFVFLPLEMQYRFEQTKVHNLFSYFVWKETTHNLLKRQLQKPFSPVCTLLVKLASMNVFYSMW